MLLVKGLGDRELKISYDLMIMIHQNLQEGSSLGYEHWFRVDKH